MKIPVRYPTLVWTAIVAAVFSLIVGLLMTLDFVGRGKYELFDTPAYLALKQQLKDHPGDAQLQQAIRELDLHLRDTYFRNRQFMAMGMYMLLGGVVLALLAARWAVSVARRDVSARASRSRGRCRVPDAALRPMGDRGRGGDRRRPCCADSRCARSRLRRPRLRTPAAAAPTGHNHRRTVPVDEEPTVRPTARSARPRHRARSPAAARAVLRRVPAAMAAIPRPDRFGRVAILGYPRRVERARQHGDRLEDRRALAGPQFAGRVAATRLSVRRHGRGTGGVLFRRRQRRIAVATRPASDETGRRGTGSHGSHDVRGSHDGHRRSARVRHIRHRVTWWR